MGRKVREKMSRVQFDSNRLKYAKEYGADESRRSRDKTICTHLNNGEKFIVIMEKSSANGISIKDARRAVVRVMRGNAKNNMRLGRLMQAMEPKFQPGFQDDTWYEGELSSKDLSDRLTLQQFEEAFRQAFGEQFTRVKVLNEERGN
jgi:hypothetical protein